MKNITETVTSYVHAWNEQSFETVKAAFTACCATGVTYTDERTPLITGIDTLANLAMYSHEKFPGRTFSVLSQPEYFDGQCYYSWGVKFPGKDEIAGRDFIEYDDDNLITRIVGFIPAQP